MVVLGFRGGRSPRRLLADATVSGSRQGLEGFELRRPLIDSSPSLQCSGERVVLPFHSNCRPESQLQKGGLRKLKATSGAGRVRLMFSSSRVSDRLALPLIPTRPVPPVVFSSRHEGHWATPAPGHGSRALHCLHPASCSDSAPAQALCRSRAIRRNYVSKTKPDEQAYCSPVLAGPASEGPSSVTLCPSSLACLAAVESRPAT